MHRKRSKSARQRFVVKPRDYVEDDGKIGSSTEFKDTTYLRLLDYSHTEPHLANSRRQTGKTHSLKAICATVLARHASSVTKDHLSATGNNWNTWCCVWETILTLEKDSPSVFKNFSSSFSNEPGFFAHHISVKQKHRKLRNSNRDAYIGVNSINRKHRFETLYSNISISHLVFDLNYLNSKFINISILNISGIDATQVYHLVSNIKSLVYLNVTGCKVTRIILKSWVIAMKSGKMPRLTCLILNENSELDSLNDIYNITNDNTNLTYIETTILNVKRGGNWERLDDPVIHSLTDSLKLKKLWEEKLINVDLNQTILDYRLQNRSIENETSYDSEELWRLRFLDVKNHAKIRSLIRKGVDIKRKPTTKVIKKRKVSKVRKINMKSFLDL